MDCEYILIKGKPGTGKSHTVKVVIEESLEEDYTVCYATPTGIVTSSYRSQFVEESFYCDTIHVMFKYPVAKEDKPMVNWELGQFNVLIIDKLSMVPEKIFRQFHVRPVVLLCGDQQQQQPIATVEGKTWQTQGILNNKEFYKQCVVVDFLKQHRCRDTYSKTTLTTYVIVNRADRFLGNFLKIALYAKKQSLTKCK